MKLAKNIIIISRRIKNNKRLFVIVIRTYTNTFIEIYICSVMLYRKLKHKQNSWIRIKLHIILFRLVAIAIQRHIYTHILYCWNECLFSAFLSFVRVELHSLYERHFGYFFAFKLRLEHFYGMLNADDIGVITKRNSCIANFKCIINLLHSFAFIYV